MIRGRGLTQCCARVKPMLGNIRRLAGIVTYGRPWWTALAMGDPPRKIVKRYLTWFANRARGSITMRSIT